MAPRKKSGRTTKPVRVDSSIARKAEHVAEDRGIDTSEYLSEILRGPVERDWARILKRIEEQEKKGGD